MALANHDETADARSLRSVHGLKMVGLPLMGSVDALGIVLEVGSTVRVHR